MTKAHQYIAAGYRFLDLEKFFDRVNHDKLMAKIAKRISDKQLRKLIRAFLRAGVMEGGSLGASLLLTSAKANTSWLFGRLSLMSCAAYLPLSLASSRENRSGLHPLPD